MDTILRQIYADWKKVKTRKPPEGLALLYYPVDDSQKPEIFTVLTDDRDVILVCSSNPEQVYGICKNKTRTVRLGRDLVYYEAAPSQEDYEKSKSPIRSIGCVRVDFSSIILPGLKTQREKEFITDVLKHVSENVVKTDKYKIIQTQRMRN